MTNTEKPRLAEAVEEAINREVFINFFVSKYGVPDTIIRPLVAKVGLSLPKVYSELRPLGYIMPSID